MSCKIFITVSVSISTPMTLSKIISSLLSLVLTTPPRIVYHIYGPYHIIIHSLSMSGPFYRVPTLCVDDGPSIHCTNYLHSISHTTLNPPQTAKISLLGTCLSHSISPYCLISSPQLYMPLQSTPLKLVWALSSHHH